MSQDDDRMDTLNATASRRPVRQVDLEAAFRVATPICINLNWNSASTGVRLSGVKAFALEESWEVIRKVFPADLDVIARQSGSLCRARNVGDAETLLRLLLMHGGGLSLQQTVRRACEQGLKPALARWPCSNGCAAAPPSCSAWPANSSSKCSNGANRSVGPAATAPAHRCDHPQRAGPDGQLLAPALQLATAGLGLRSF